MRIDSYSLAALLAGLLAALGALLLGRTLLDVIAIVARRAWWRVNPAAAANARLRRALARYGSHEDCWDE